MDAHEIFETTTLIVGCLLGIITFSRTVRGWFNTNWCKFKAKRKARREMPCMINKMYDTIHSMDDRLKKVEYEVSPNSSGSMKDKIDMIQSELEANNWLYPKPTFRTTSSGINTFVNEAYCELCDASSEELMRVGWRNFMWEEDKIDDIYHKWLACSEKLSQFVETIKIKDKKGNYRGEWLVKVKFLGSIEQEGKTDHLWHGVYYPIDDCAIKIAAEFEGLNYIP